MTISQRPRLDVTVNCKLSAHPRRQQGEEAGIRTRQVLESGDTLQNIIFCDECSVSLEQYWRTCYRKIDEMSKRKPRPKYLLKI